MYQYACFIDHHGNFWICRMLNVILTTNKTCKTNKKLQCVRFTLYLGLLLYYIGLAVSDTSVSADSECVSNRKHCSYYTFASHQKSVTVKRQSAISRL